MKTIELDITEEIINAAIPRSSGHCVIADALKQARPELQRISVDLQTIRFTDPVTKTRYIYLTPAKGQRVLTGFDQGERVPCKIRLTRPVQIIPHRGGYDPEKKKAQNKISHERAKARRTMIKTKSGQGVQTIIGGDAPPLGALPSYGGRRTFGIKNLSP